METQPALLDGAGDGIPPLIDLHLHSTASDGELSPEEVVRRAARAGLTAIALTDHDTLAGVEAAQAEGRLAGLQVVGGCEFSVSAAWGEMHVLGYFLPVDRPALLEFLADCRRMREERGRRIVEQLQSMGLTIELEDLVAAAAGGAIGRPHVARALVKRGAALTVDDAFDRYIGRGRPGFVAKELPSFRQVAELVHASGGVVSAAHIKERGTRTVLRRLKEEGLDAVETRHPRHDPDLRALLTERALSLHLARTGGSDWHGESEGSGGGIGSQQVPDEWLERLAAARPVTTSPEVP